MDRLSWLETGREGEGRGTICAGEVPGLAPQKTQILILGGLGLSDGSTLVVLERTLFSFERPWGVFEPGMSGVEERIEIAGEAPPDAMIKE
jgi:hypothetical protein